MTETTLLDEAHAAMSGGGDDTARLRFYERFADGELFLLLEAEAQGDQVSPRVIDDQGTTFVTVFDREDRLTRYAGGVAPYAGLSGRSLVEMIKGQGLGVALNPGVASSDTLIAPQSIDWLAQTLANAPVEAQARPVELRAPGTVPEVLLTALDRKLASAIGLAQAAWLAGVVYDDDSTGHLLAFVGAIPDAQPAIAAAVAEALTFSGLEAGALDVTFVGAEDAITARLARVGLRFDLPMPEGPKLTPPPGSDPDRPPRLK